MSSDGAYAVADLLIDDKCAALMEVHLAWNLICNTGLNSLFTALAMSNSKLKFIDLAYNFMDISVLHSLRRMLERNTTLKYLSLNDLHRFNERAVESLAPSFASNQALKMVDLKQVTREFYEYMTETVNGGRGLNPIEFRRDEKFLAPTGKVNYQPLRGPAAKEELAEAVAMVENQRKERRDRVVSIENANAVVRSNKK